MTIDGPRRPGEPCYGTLPKPPAAPTRISFWVEIPKGSSCRRQFNPTGRFNGICASCVVVDASPVTPDSVFRWAELLRLGTSFGDESADLARRNENNGCT